MTKVIHIEYCEVNQKYDSFIDGEYRGKHYTLKECLSSIMQRTTDENE